MDKSRVVEVLEERSSYMPNGLRLCEGLVREWTEKAVLKTGEEGTVNTPVSSLVVAVFTKEVFIGVGEGDSEVLLDISLLSRGGVGVFRPSGGLLKRE